MDDPIRIQTTPTFGQYLQFCRLGIGRRTRMIKPFAILCLICFLLAPTLPSEGNPGALAQYKSSAMVLILPAFVFVLLPLVTYFAARQRWRTAAEAREPRSFEFNDWGISIKGLTFSAEAAWTNIPRAETAGPLILLYTRQELGYLIPRDAMTPEQEASLRVLLRNTVTNCKRL